MKQKKNISVEDDSVDNKPVASNGRKRRQIVTEETPNSPRSQGRSKRQRVQPLSKDQSRQPKVSAAESRTALSSERRQKVKAIQKLEEEGYEGQTPTKPKKAAKIKQDKEAEAMPLAPRASGLSFRVGAHVYVIFKLGWTSFGTLNQFSPKNSVQDQS